MDNRKQIRPLERIVAVGDIHGCLDKLQALMEMVKPNKNDTFVFLGDYINRGPCSKGVIDYLLDFKTRVPSIFLLGNHEQMLLESLSDNSPSFELNGGRVTLESYNCTELIGMPNDHINFFKELRHYHETDEFIFVHAGLKPGCRLSDQNVYDLVWIREEFIQSAYDWGKTIVYGHTCYRSPILLPNRIGLDTGCVYSAAEGYGQLSCCDVKTRTIWSI